MNLENLPTPTGLTPALKKVLWAIDAFEGHPPLVEAQAALLNAWSRRSPSKLEALPVTLLNPEQLGLPGELPPQAVENYVPAAQKALEARIRTLQSRLTHLGMLAPRVLASTGVTIRSSVQALIQDAQAHHCDAIVVGSHGRKGLSRLLLGSFAEELLIRSPLPVLILPLSALSPEESVKKEQTAEPQKAAAPLFLVATDFTEASRQVLNSAIHLARQVGARLHLIHSAPRPLQAVIDSGIYLVSGGWVSSETFLRDSDTRLERELQHWARDAREAGLTVTSQLDTESSSVPVSILKAQAERNAAVLFLAAESKKVAATVLGSVARHVVRQAHCPVWIERLQR